LYQHLAAVEAVLKKCVTA